MPSASGRDGGPDTSGLTSEKLVSASAATAAEGTVGGGAGMVCSGFKGGIGASSRRLESG